MVQEGPLTICAVPVFPGSRMISISMAWASPNEKKIRRKVGEFYALRRWYSGKSIQIPLNFHYYWSLEDQIQNLADFLTA